MDGYVISKNPQFDGFAILMVVYVNPSVLRVMFIWHMYLRSSST